MHNGHLFANILSKDKKKNRSNKKLKAKMNSFSQKILIMMCNSRNMKTAL